MEREDGRVGQSFNYVDGKGQIRTREISRKALQASHLVRNKSLEHLI